MSQLTLTELIFKITIKTQCYTITMQNKSSSQAFALVFVALHTTEKHKEDYKKQVWQQSRT